MAGLMLDTYDRFGVMYDIISELAEQSLTEHELASKMGVSVGIVKTMISLLLVEGFLKLGRTSSDMRLTSQGFAFLQEFAGIRKFVG